MVEDNEHNQWSANRIAALILTLALAMLAVYAWRTQPMEHRTFYLLCIGVLLGGIYTVRGGSLPTVVHRIAGPHLTADDDVRNLPPKVYLLVLLLVILVAAAACYFFYPRR